MDLIDLRQLRMFHALAESRSFTAAAQRLFVTQSAVSHSIKGLEQSLDCRLFERTAKSVALTEPGRILLRRTQRMFHEMQLATDELSRLTSWGGGRLRIGATITMCQYLLPSVLREFRESFPDCEIRIEPGDTDVLTDLLDRGEIDIALGLKLPQESRYTSRPLFSDNLALVFSPTHRFASAKEIDPSSLVDEHLIVYSRTSHTYRLIEKSFERLGLPFKRPLELGSMEAIKELARINLGVAILAPWVASTEIAEGKLMTLPMGNDAPGREWVLMHGAKAKLTLAEETFAGLCESVAGSFVLNRKIEMDEISKLPLPLKAA